MARFPLITIFAVVVAILLQEASALKCWNCTNSKEYCADPFKGDRISYLGDTLIDCQARSGQPICVKAKSTSTGQIRRACAGDEQEVQKFCNFNSGSVDICETCNTDACNDGSVAQYAPITIVALLLAYLLWPFYFVSA